MAEALAGLGVAVSVFAVVQISEDVISKCSAYRVAHKNAPENMRKFSDQVSGLHGVLTFTSS
ncbi:hypothetical protein JB92DRAFT_3116903 [Gautieria morchelliformis]|nr:hypothetical protein JB92DRAFT_3116903 [Gautieria morchelliformis]